MYDTISKSLAFLQAYLHFKNENVQFVEITNIATLNDGDNFIETALPIVLSVVNIEEDKVMRKPTIYQSKKWITNESESGGEYIESVIKDKNTKYQKLKNPLLNLNIHLLFSTYKKNKTDINNYTDLIDQLEKVISCFQNQSVFKEEDFIIDGNNPLRFPEKTEKIFLEMVNLSMEGLNQMWSFLGNKYMPSVLYKMRVLSILPEETAEIKASVDSVRVQLIDSNEVLREEKIAKNLTL